MKKVWAVIAVLVIGYLGYDTYKSYKGGFFDMPHLGENDFSVSFKSGFRGVLRNITNERPSRRYISYSANDVPI